MQKIDEGLMDRCLQRHAHEPIYQGVRNAVADYLAALPKPEPAGIDGEAAAYAEIYLGKVVKTSVHKSGHCTVPLYLQRPSWERAALPKPEPAGEAEKLAAIIDATRAKIIELYAPDQGEQFPREAMEVLKVLGGEK